MRDFGKFLRLYECTDEEGIKAQAPQNSKGPTFAMERAMAPWTIAGLGRLGGLVSPAQALRRRVHTRGALHGMFCASRTSLEPVN